MTRKHFQAIADTIRALDLAQADRAKVAQDFAQMLKGHPARFDFSRFLKACEVTK